MQSTNTSNPRAAAAAAAPSARPRKTNAAESGTGGSPASPQPAPTPPRENARRVLECGTSVPLCAKTSVSRSGASENAEDREGGRDTAASFSGVSCAHGTKVPAVPRHEVPTTPVAKRAGTSGTKVPHSKTRSDSFGCVAAPAARNTAAPAATGDEQDACPTSIAARRSLFTLRPLGHAAAALALALGSVFTAAADARAADDAPAQKLVIKGSDTLGAKLVPMLAEEYKARHPGITFEIAAEGSTTGIAAIIDGTAQIGMSSRRAKTIEISAGTAKNVKLQPTIVAYDGIGVILNAANPIRSLTRRQIEQIFTGDITDWSALGGAPGRISIYTRNTSSGTYADFKELAMSKRDYARLSQKMAGNEQIAAEVARNSNGVGYVGLAYLGSNGVKTLAISGVLPTPATIQAKTYPLARPTFYYTDGAPAALAAQFVEFTLSPEGQKIAEKVGFVPATADAKPAAAANPAATPAAAAANPAALVAK